MFHLTRKVLFRSGLCRNLEKNWIVSQYKCQYSSSSSSLFVHPPQDKVPDLTSTKLIEIFSTEIGHAKEYSRDGILASGKQRQALMDLVPAPEDNLPARKMEDSFVSVVVPLKSEPLVRDRYVSARGRVRIGRLLEDMDILAGYSCVKHIFNPKSAEKQYPYIIVTALVDRIHIVKDIMNSREDVRLSGHVTYTGRSSMEVGIIVDQKDADGKYQKFFDAVFLMVARDPLNKGSARINPLLAETNEEKEFLKKGAARQQLRKQREDVSIFKKAPNEEEIKIIHERFMNKMTNPSGASRDMKKMKDTVLKTVIICQPQNRNRSNKIFGGFIMRNAFELAYTSAMIYGKKRPRIIYIDNIKFHTPVEIGAFLRFRSHIGYVENNFVHTVVVAETINHETGEIRKSNEFHFTFIVPREDSEEPIPEVDFETYEEAIYYLNSRRHFKHMMYEFGCPDGIP